MVEGQRNLTLPCTLIPVGAGYCCCHYMISSLVEQKNQGQGWSLCSSHFSLAVFPRPKIMSTALVVTMKERCFFPHKGFSLEVHKGFSLEVQDSLVSRKEEFILSQTLIIVKGRSVPFSQYSCMEHHPLLKYYKHLTYLPPPPPISSPLISLHI